MNRLIIIALALLFLGGCQKYTFNREQRLREQGKIHCGWYGKKTIAECRKTYPFNEAAKIVLISFPDYENDGLVDTYKKDTSSNSPKKRTYIQPPVKITQPILDTLKIFSKRTEFITVLNVFEICNTPSV